MATVSTTRAVKPGRVAAILGLMAASVAVWLLPWIFGPVALVAGVWALVKGDRLGWVVIGLAFVCFGIGLLVYAVPAKLLGP